MKEDPTIDAIREARRKISASVGHDPRKLVEHYRARQKRHRERLVHAPLKHPGAKTRALPNHGVQRLDNRSVCSCLVSATSKRSHPWPESMMI